jgi:hypothetical protein
MMVPTAVWLGAAILVAAGLWQVTPLRVRPMLAKDLLAHNDNAHRVGPES